MWSEVSRQPPAVSIFRACLTCRDHLVQVCSNQQLPSGDWEKHIKVRPFRSDPGQPWQIIFTLQLSARVDSLCWARLTVQLLPLSNPVLPASFLAVGLYLKICVLCLCIFFQETPLRLETDAQGYWRASCSSRDISLLVFLPKGQYRLGNYLPTCLISHCESQAENAMLRVGDSLGTVWLPVSVHMLGLEPFLYHGLISVRKLFPRLVQEWIQGNDSQCYLNQKDVHRDSSTCGKWEMLWNNPQTPLWEGEDLTWACRTHRLSSEGCSCFTDGLNIVKEKDEAMNDFIQFTSLKVHSKYKYFFFKTVDCIPWCSFVKKGICCYSSPSFGPSPIQLNISTFIFYD